MRPRDTPWGRTRHGVSRVPNFVWSSPNPRFCSQFHHIIWCPDLSYPQAQRRKQAKNNTPTHHLAATVKPARFQQGRRGRATSRKRWNDAVGATLAHGPGGEKRTAARTWPPSTGFRRRTAFAGSRKGLPWRCHAKAFPWGRGTRGPPAVGVTQRPSMDGLSQAMAGPPTAVNGRRIHAMAAANPAGIK